MEEYRDELNPEMMEDAGSHLSEDPNAIIYHKLRQYFDGKIVRKDLTKKLRKGQMYLSMSLSFCLASIAALMIRKSSMKASRM